MHKRKIPEEHYLFLISLNKLCQKHKVWLTCSEVAFKQKNNKFITYYATVFDDATVVADINNKAVLENCEIE